MDCNCDNNKGGEGLRMVRGNDFTLRVAVKRREVASDGTVTLADMDLTGSTAIAVTAVNWQGRRKAMAFTAEGGSTLLVPFSGADTPSGVYGIEVTGTDKDTGAWRFYAAPGELLTVVEPSSAGSVPGQGQAEGYIDLTVAAAALSLPTQLVERMEATEQQVAKAEADRQQAEQARAESETARNEAEDSRAAAEQERVDADFARMTAEDSREQAESRRDTAERQRAANEDKRTEAEQARQRAESGRAKAENDRTKAEAGRAEAEKAREQAENDRDTAEKAREQAMAGKADVGSTSFTLGKAVAVYDNGKAEQSVLAVVGASDGECTAGMVTMYGPSLNPGVSVDGTFNVAGLHQFANRNYLRLMPEPSSAPEGYRFSLGAEGNDAKTAQTCTLPTTFTELRAATPEAGDSSARVATTAFVAGAVAGMVGYEEIKN